MAQLFPKLMTVENLSRLVGSKLSKTPKIAAIEGFCFNPKKVKNADAFIALDTLKEDIDEAIANGAYAVIFDDDIKMTNDEIAYIKVSDIKRAIYRLINYFIVSKNITIYSVDPLQEAILDYLGVGALLKESNLEKSFFKIYDGESDTKFVAAKEFAAKLSKQSSFVVSALSQEPTLFSYGLFYSKFGYEDRLYELAFPRVFLKELCELLSFLDREELSYRLTKRPFDHFKPLFLNQNYEPIDFGESRRVFIIESDPFIFERAALFLRKIFPNSSYLAAPLYYQNRLKADMYYYNIKELEIRANDFYLLILGDMEEILKKLSPQKSSNRLF
ncbi:hypothetical protein [uncultured Campylobacter sp.]|uniref:hypothetical protein n=1 Tax=uncultured Campylobacter sp. TaxID=218934 RepID=UPI00260E880F|nr:hypothetical protein [uncultured Campylobacter sp.]